ncbi:MAG: ASCH domain-containing protein [Pseudomonadota bacterium]
MQFAKQLREGVRRGDITTSVRVWMAPRVKVGGRYRLEDGHVLIEGIRQITFEDITPAMARASGFASVPDLLRTAVHGKGRNVYLVRFRYESGPAG